MKKFTRKTNASDFFSKLELHQTFTTSESLTPVEVYTAALQYRVILRLSTTRTNGSKTYEVVGALPRHYEVVDTNAPGEAEVWAIHEVLEGSSGTRTYLVDMNQLAVVHSDLVDQMRADDIGVSVTFEVRDLLVQTQVDPPATVSRVTKIFVS